MPGAKLSANRSANRSANSNKVLVKMLDRLFAALVNGPGLNARPHNSRQRIDLTLLDRLGDVGPDDALRKLLGDLREVKLAARVAPPKRRPGAATTRRRGTNGNAGAAAGEGAQAPGAGADGESIAERAWLDQQALLGKLRVIADDARTYEQDTGVHVLNVGFPLLSLPPGTFDRHATSSSRRILAPVAFIPVAVTLTGGATQNVKIECRGEGMDLVVPNHALLAWLEQQTGKPAATELFSDQFGDDPWREVCELVAYVCKALDLKVPETFIPPPENKVELGKPKRESAGGPGTPPPLPSRPVVPRMVEPEPEPVAGKDLTPEEIDAELSPEKRPKPHDAAPAGAASAGAGAAGLPEAPLEPIPELPEGLARLTLLPAPRAEDGGDERARIVPAAILGLFPMANQGLLRDMQAMVAGEGLAGPVQSFIDLGASLFAEEKPADENESAAGEQPAETRLELEGEDETAVAESPASAPPSLPREEGPPPVEYRPRAFTEERLVTTADPFQSRAVKLARESRGLVVHGPPGTGKSQTITNIIGDHLSRGQRVLLVCDKRTALDVVADRLKHMGLGRLCALIHDPQRDQRELYRDVREQLDELVEARSDEKAAERLAKVDADLQKLHVELSEYRDALMRPDARHGLSLHDLIGQWLGLAPASVIADAPAATDDAAAPPAEPDRPQVATAEAHPAQAEARRAPKGGYSLAEGTLDTTDLREVDSSAAAVRDVLTRARDVDFDHNPWAKCAGISLKDFLARPMEQVRAAMGVIVAAAKEADATADPAVPPFPEGADLVVHGQARTDLAQQLETALGNVAHPVLARWAASSPEGGSAKELREARQKIDEAKGFVQTFRAGPLDPELTLIVRAPGKLPDFATIAEQAGIMAQYLEAEEQWWSFLAFRQKRQATAVLMKYGLTLNPDKARRLGMFLTALQARLVLRDLVAELNGSAIAVNTPDGAPVLIMDDAAINKAIADHTAALDLLINVHDDYPLQVLAGRVAKVLDDPSTAPAFLEALRKSPARAAALHKLEAAMVEARLFETAWLSAVERKLRGGQTAANFLTTLHNRVESLEGVLRVRQGLADLPKFIRPAAEQLLHQGASSDDGLAVLRRDMLYLEITRRLRGQPHLQSVDGQRLKQAFERYRELDAEKKDLTRDAVLHQWLTRQKERLLAGTGSRLNGMGADLKRRLTSRGERAMRLRQVVAVGKDAEGGDPLFDLRPVWMASPETVAQVFPLEPIFDVVVFDEASQCRLEEALPVLVRGRRVTIAGDPKQLPPTRFFESAVAASDDDAAEIETDQQLFEMQQGETEDLLTAALGLDIQQCYLNVHYRSRHADLIAFSNRHFYGSRLQPIPGHPRARSAPTAITLYRVGGTYEKRQNEAEAERVVEIVKELLDRRTPPSVGVACFNLQQRDLIVEKLDGLAAEDSSFAKKLADARVRRGEGSFEGLFVKNLENVQGDERDHIIISTTYGPDARGKFYRRFGPLGRSGGGRRLNVLVTRAREQVHLVTSIPGEAYRSLPPVPPGQSAGGGWLLFAYLKFADELERAARGEIQREPAEKQDQMVSRPARGVTVRPTKEPSHFAEALGRKLAEAHGVEADVHWGNEGFCVDVALRRADAPNEMAAGLLCDTSRFGGTEDPMEWDVFRTGVLEKQGWRLLRVWTPHFFRDPRGAAKAIVREVQDSPGPAGDNHRQAAAVAKPAGRL